MSDDDAEIEDENRIGERPENCVFCDIVAGEEPAYHVYEDDRTAAFLDTSAVAEGHTLVVPRTHRESLTAVDSATAGALFRTARTVARALVTTLDPAGYNVIHSTGDAAGQDVAHVHLHVIPRAPDDDIRFAPPRRQITESEGERTAALLREGVAGTGDGPESENEDRTRG